MVPPDMKTVCVVCCDEDWVALAVLCAVLDDVMKNVMEAWMFYYCFSVEMCVICGSPY